MSGRVSSSSRTVSSKSLAVSVGNPTMMSVDMVNLPNFLRNLFATSRKVSAVWPRLMSARTRLLPLWTGT